MKRYDSKRYYRGGITGTALLLNTSPYCVIDIDVKQNSLDTDNVQMILNDLNERCKIVRTTSGGFHIYCLWDDSIKDLDKNRFVKCYKCDSFDIDLFLPVPREKRSIVVLPETQAKNHKGEIGTYELISDVPDDDLCKFSDVRDSLKAFGIVFDLNNKVEKAEKKVEQFLKEIDEIDVEEDDIMGDVADGECSLELLNVKGFNGLEIHNDSLKIEKEITLPILFKSILACKSEEITSDVIEEKCSYIFENARLTDNAKANFWNAFMRAKKEGPANCSYGNLIKMLKIHNAEYYESNILRLFKPVKATTDDFINSNYTINDYKRNNTTFKTIDDHIRALMKCVANDTNGGYFVRKYNAESNTVHYEHLTLRGLRDCFDDLKVNIKLSDAEKQKLKEQKKAIKEFKTYSLVNLLTTNTYKDRLTYFDGSAILSNDPRVLQLFIPPVGKYDRSLITDFIEFMKSRVVNEKPLMEELASHAYRLRHKSAFIEKFFIHYEGGEGNTGKSFFNARLGSMYRNYANIAATPEQVVSDMFNAWQKNLLMLHMEEVQNENYRNKNMERVIKRLTTLESSGRGMYKETESSKNKAIVGFNTNQPDLYGLVRADKATLSRLVIIEFKDYDNSFDWDDMKNKYINDPNFAYSLYKYLLEEFEIPSSFKTYRYHSPEKDEFIKKACHRSKNNVESWLEEANENELFDKQTWGDVEYYWCKTSYIASSYKEYCRNNCEKFSFKRDNFISQLLSMGFEEKKINAGEQRGVRALRIEANKFEELVKSDVEEIDPPDNWDKDCFF